MQSGTAAGEPSVSPLTYTFFAIARLNKHDGSVRWYCARPRYVERWSKTLDTAKVWTNLDKARAARAALAGHDRHKHSVSDEFTVVSFAATHGSIANDDTYACTKCVDARARLIELCAGMSEAAAAIDDARNALAKMGVR